MSAQAGNDSRSCPATPLWAPIPHKPPITHKPRSSSVFARMSADAENGLVQPSDAQPAISALTYSRSDIYKSARVQKLGTEFTWKPKLILLSATNLWFTSNDDDEQESFSSGGAPDCIPLHEIASIRNSIAFARDLTSGSLRKPRERHSSDGAETLAQPSVSETELKKSLSNILKGDKGEAPKGKLRDRSSSGGSFSSLCFDIVTTAEGLHSGRIYTVKMETRAGARCPQPALAQCDVWN